MADANESILTTEEVERYHEQGFLALESFISADEVLRMRAIYDRLFAERAGRSAGDQFDLAGADEEGGEARLPQILKPSQYAPELLRSETVARVRAVLAALLGPTATMGGDHAINKPPRHGAETPWHQDEAYWDPAYTYRSLSIWIPLQEATVDNGCMQFIPGSHRGEVLPHRQIGGDSRVHGLEVVPGTIDVSAAVACPLPPGGAAIHTNRTVHYASANHSDDHRRAYIVGGGTPREPVVVPREYPWRAGQQTTARARRAQRVTRTEA
ncbi:phytanoyl-CoA dioxygenase family protein [Actinopolymorpha singaporensis]|uniref:Ectoine hydroxylase-related dioxygenase, phytanoyl-CoA dioxygenase (PhyH) family n=1 Tax=Actinopolymorpha singaporensis TaxID=117157 RepID=A0A1H1MLZ8_9ACTN|nr:phytanoyl-CoA dioxygenase family protein [Actinopolymorpha singaporensis]SDR87672.1 Ectoine hydroxylase-related dioxygenase, phytanoyl-CoA dioxygenase (PhyH) family [Actinopolymorpha singaporensis]